MSILLPFAHPHSWTPNVHTGRSACLYKSSLLYIDSSDRRPSSQYIFSEFDLQFLLFLFDVRLTPELGIKRHSEVLCYIGRGYPNAIKMNGSLINLLVGDIDICRLI
jgi:hypothetical protein